MSSPDAWLELRSRNPGLEGPYVQEYHKPYQALDKLGTIKPDIILAIGTEASTRFFLTERQVHPAKQAAKQAVTLSPVALNSQQALLINCQLPLRCELSRIPDAVDLGHHTLHHLKGAFHDASQVSSSLYIELLAPFSSVVLLFVSDFGPTSRLVDFLWAWLRSAMLKPPPFCPEFVLVVETNSQVRLSTLQSRLIACGMKALRVSDPQHPYTEADVEKIKHTYLSLSVLSTAVDHTFPQSLQSVLKASRRKRQNAGFDFSALHWKALVRSALAQHADQSTLPINLHHLSRIRKPVPLGIKTHITDFVQSTKGGRIDQATVIASALTMDAYPPRMHRFLPTDTFQAIYKPLIQSTIASQLVKSIEEAFERIATRNHSKLRVQISLCPLCREPNSFVFDRKPATANCRVLRLTGSYSPRLLETVSSQLVSKFFYIEATSEVNFYTAPEQYRFLVKCRLPPGPAVLDLFQRLHQSKAYLSHYESEGNSIKIPLITRRILGRCKALQSFSIEISVSLRSLDSLVDIKIGGMEESPQSISKCPYRLRDLIQDQGLGCPFGTEDHQQESMKQAEKRKKQTNIELSLEELYRTLQQIQ
ncbi:hypothetical protein LZ30DRAFT_607654 [Colletotrichum cereale]|nr:hypothetical protein LZ30DRAFT_607654 [Colletotrichum cereale]